MMTPWEVTEMHLCCEDTGFICRNRLSVFGLLTIDGMVAISVVKGLVTAATLKTFINGGVVSVL
jgi:hypothetical protein